MADDRFYVKTLRMQNFRCFEDVELGPFDPSFNLLVGENGVGKSSILLALASLFRQLAAHEMDDARNSPLQMRDVISVNRVGADGILHRGHRFGGSISAECQWGGEPWVAREQISGEPFEADGLIFHKDRKTSFRLRQTRNDDGGSKIEPILIRYTPKRNYYGVSGPEFADKENLDFRRVGAFWTWSSPSTYSNYFLEWLKDQTIFALQGDRRNIDAHGGLEAARANRQLTLLKQALVSVDEEILDFIYDAAARDAATEYKNGKIEYFSQFSDGRRALIGLVADIVRRVCYLNAELLGAETLGKTPGLVLIDEIDLHLHPKWQRQIVPALKKIFPKIQFFATTHSPQVIGECGPEEIVLLGKDGQQRRPIGSYGRESNWILECVMEAEGRDPKIAKRLKTLWRDIEEGEFEKARVQIRKLRKDIGDDPDIIGAESYMWRVEHVGDEAAE